MTEGQAPPPPPPPSEPPAQQPPPPPGYQPPAPAPAGPPHGRYPAVYQVDFHAGERNRLTAFFRLLVAIPWLIVGIFYVIAWEVLLLVAWIVIVVTGRYPEDLYEWNSGILRFSTSLSGFVHLVTDEWPPFGWAQDPNQPQRVLFAQPAEKQSRLKVFFRGILIIPLLFAAWGIQMIGNGTAIASWMTIVFRGYQPRWVFDATIWVLNFQLRIGAYATLLSDAYPPVGEDAPKFAQTLAEANQAA